MSPSAPHIVLVGAGHAHLHSLAHLDALTREGASVTVVSPSPFWYSGMGPGVLSGLYEPSQATVNVEAMVNERGARFIRGYAVSFDAGRRRLVVDNGETLAYDALSLNIGSVVPEPPGIQMFPRIFPVKPVANFLALRRCLLGLAPGKSVRVAVIGGGPAGCETAANIRALCHRHGQNVDIRLLTAADRLLTDFPPKASRRMAEWCEKHHVAMATGHRVERVDAEGLVLVDGTLLMADIVVLATGVRPPDVLRGSGFTVDAKGALVVNPGLQSVSHPEVFGGGDCIAFDPNPLPAVGVHAVKQAPVLFRNLLAATGACTKRVFRPQRRYMLILNMGQGNGLLTRGAFMASGRLPFRLKTWLDCRFMRRNRAHLTHDAVTLFARFPVAGKAKTRMIPALGPDGAARLHRRLAEHAVAVARQAREAQGMSVNVAFTGGCRGDFRAWMGPDLQFIRQPPGNLGARLHHAIEHVFADGAGRVLMVGTDVPGICADTLRQAFGLLADHDVVLGPAGDGGYYLIGMNHCRPELFTGIDWGSERVAEQTRSVITRDGLAVAELPMLDDVDRPEDLDRLRNDPRFADVFTGSPLVSVIIPTLNEAEVLPTTLERFRGVEGVEIVVADGGSHDATCEVAGEAGAAVIEVVGGRAAQMNAGAARVSGRYLLFLHADTLLPDGFADTVRRTLDNPAAVAGAFRFRTDGSGLRMRLVEWGTNLRSTQGHRPYGDQGVFLEKRVFNELGGFADLPVMEDFDLVRRLRRRGRVVTVPDCVITSSRRWRRLGVLRTMLRNQVMILGYQAGVSSERLARFYRNNHGGHS